jgi:hypothetical protein
MLGYMYELISLYASARLFHSHVRRSWRQVADEPSKKKLFCVFVAKKNNFYHVLRKDDATLSDNCGLVTASGRKKKSQLSNQLISPCCPVVHHKLIDVKHFCLLESRFLSLYNRNISHQRMMQICRNLSDRLIN